MVLRPPGRCDAHGTARGIDVERTRTGHMPGNLVIDTGPQRERFEEQGPELTVLGSAPNLRQTVPVYCRCMAGRERSRNICPMVRMEAPGWRGHPCRERHTHCQKSHTGRHDRRMQVRLLDYHENDLQPKGTASHRALASFRMTGTPVQPLFLRTSGGGEFRGRCPVHRRGSSPLNCALSPSLPSPRYCP